jgi:pyruvate dehydrogenase phosphatase
MRRAAVRTFLTARLTSSRGLALRNRTSLLSSNYALGTRFASGKSAPTLQSPTTQSMYIRRFSVALVSSLVGYGAWYIYKDNGINAQQARGLSNSTSSFPSQAQTTAAERKALIVGADELYTGAIQGEGPISKDTDESGRKVLEMLTPEQATQRLRRNEESYLVGRGKGVVRYDVVQIPSNDPIEDDHSEKIIEIPQALGATNPISDWMFWGVFDGHS